MLARCVDTLTASSVFVVMRCYPRLALTICHPKCDGLEHRRLRRSQSTQRASSRAVRAVLPTVSSRSTFRPFVLPLRFRPFVRPLQKTQVIRPSYFRFASSFFRLCCHTHASRPSAAESDHVDGAVPWTTVPLYILLNSL